MVARPQVFPDLERIRILNSKVFSFFFALPLCVCAHYNFESKGMGKPDLWAELNES